MCVLIDLVMYRFLIDVYVVAGSTGRTILSAVHELIEVYLRVSFPSLPVF